MRRPATLWLATPSRYAGWPVARARVALGLLLLLALALTIQPERPAAAPAAQAIVHRDTDSDLALYREVVAAVRYGDDYYAATARELRARPDYPLRPFVTFRLPTLAELQAWLPDWATTVLQLALVALVAASWLIRLGDLLPARAPRVVAGFLLAGGLAVSAQPYLNASHELWAALLVAESLAVWRPDRWRDAMAFALMAMLVRETAALYVLVMAGFALAGGRRRELLGWAVSLAVMALVVALHARAVWRVTGPLDMSSDGWTGLNGLWFYAMTLRHATVLELVPFVIAAPLIALALFGWTVPRHPLSRRMTAVLIAYGVLIAGFARLNNFYWGLLVGPVLLVGLAFAPDGVRDLVRAALDKRRITVTRIVR